MTTTNPVDPIHVVRAIAPPTDELSDARVHALLQQSWTLVARPAARSARRRAAVSASAVVVVALTGTVAVAAATDGHQRIAASLGRDFANNQRPDFDNTPDPSTLDVPFSIPGPRGTDFQLFTEQSKEGGLCTTALFEPHGMIDPPVNDVDPVEGGGGGGCSISQTDLSLFQSGTGDLCSPTAISSLDFVWSAPGVSRAELRLSTGAVLPVAVQNGWLGGWYTKQQVPQDVDATIVAFGADGRVLGRRPMQSKGDCTP